MLRALAKAPLQTLKRYRPQTSLQSISETPGYTYRTKSLKIIRNISIFARMPSDQEQSTDSQRTVEIPKPCPISSSSVFDSLDDDDAETLERLQQAYLEANRESTSNWLDYKKTCHIYMYRGGGHPSTSLAAFDLDGTIIKPKSNKKIPKSATDWQFFSVWTKVKLQQALRENQARFVIFTNQNGVGLKIVPLEEVQERIELVTKRLNIPCTVFVAIEKDEFRKPRTAMFQLFEKSFNPEKEIDYEKSFYCGDAVGYPSHSDADIKFAQALGLPFLPPEKFVRGVKPKLLDIQPSAESDTPDIETASKISR